MNVDFLNCDKNLWLAKVPKYVAESWNEGTEVGKIIINKKDNRGSSAGPDLQFIVKPTRSNATKNIPEKHKILMKNVTNNTLYVTSYTKKTSLIEPDPINLMYMEGKVSQRLEFRPPNNSLEYIKLKRTDIQRKNQPVHTAQKLEGPVQIYKPVSSHTNRLLTGRNNLDPFAGLSKMDTSSSMYKKVRMDRERVLEVLFTAFEKHQYYSLKDLVRITEQPVSYLKEILKDICNYNLKNPHKNMWELRPEYRHYK